MSETPLLSQSSLLLNRCISGVSSAPWHTSAKKWKNKVRSEMWILTYFLLNSMQSIKQEMSFTLVSRILSLLKRKWCLDQLFKKTKKWLAYNYKKILLKWNVTNFGISVIGWTSLMLRQIHKHTCFQNWNLWEFLGSWKSLVHFQLQIQWINE